jgi:hypothetical protein
MPSLRRTVADDFYGDERWEQFRFLFWWLGGGGGGCGALSLLWRRRWGRRLIVLVNQIFELMLASNPGWPVLRVMLRVVN